MTILHILRSEPDELLPRLVQSISKGLQSKIIPLYLRTVDYDHLLEDIFNSDKVISWW